MDLSTLYLCNLFDHDGKTTASVRLITKTDTDAILLANTLEREFPQSAGIEIRAGDRLVYMRTGEPSAASALAAEAPIGL